MEFTVATTLYNKQYLPKEHNNLQLVQNLFTLILLNIHDFCKNENMINILNTRVILYLQKYVFAKYTSV